MPSRANPGTTRLQISTTALLFSQTTESQDLSSSWSLMLPICALPLGNAAATRAHESSVLNASLCHCFTPAHHGAGTWRILRRRPARCTTKRSRSRLCPSATASQAAALGGLRARISTWAAASTSLPLSSLSPVRAFRSQCLRAVRCVSIAAGRGSHRPRVRLHHEQLCRRGARDRGAEARRGDDVGAPQFHCLKQEDRD